MSWRVPYEDGTLKAISRRNGKVELVREVQTAGDAARMFVPDRKSINHDGTDSLLCHGKDR